MFKRFVTVKCAETSLFSEQKLHAFCEKRLPKSFKAILSLCYYVFIFTVLFLFSCVPVLKQYTDRRWPLSEDAMYNWTAPGWQCLFFYCEGRDLRIAFEEFTFASCVGGLKWAHTGQCLREYTCVCVRCIWLFSILVGIIIKVCFFHFRTDPSSLKWFPTWRNACAMLRYILQFLNVILFNIAVHNKYMYVVIFK